MKPSECQNQKREGRWKKAWPREPASLKLGEEERDRRKPFFADERPQLLDEGKKSCEINQAQQPQDHEAGQPVGWLGRG